MTKFLSFLCLILSFNLGAEEFYQFKLPDINGKDFSFESLRGKPVIIVNTASQCGYTDQFKELESVYKKYKSRGLEIIAIPSNDFGGQEPLSNQQIAQFCKTNYKLSFPLLSKQPVTGRSKHPLFRFLVEQSRTGKELGWNFEKFIINKSGKVIGRFPSATPPTSLEFKKTIESVL